MSRRFIQTIHVHVGAARSIRSAADAINNQISHKPADALKEPDETE